MTTLEREVMQRALATLEGWANHGEWVWPESALRTAKNNTTQSIIELREALSQLEQRCNPHPDAPHGFDRNASHNEDRYVCECESWGPEQQKPVLDEIEQYRMQMAGICTAAIGYWKEGDSIHPDYDTPALHDVAKLYAKYDALYKEKHNPTREPEQQEPSIETVYETIIKWDECGGKRSRRELARRIVEIYPHPARKWQSLTDEDIAEIRVNGAHWLQDWVARAIEARLKEKNT